MTARNSPRGILEGGRHDSCVPCSGGLRPPDPPGGLLAGVLSVLLLAGCGGTSSSPSATPVSTPAPAASPSTGSLNMVLRAQVTLAALGASGGSGNWGYTTPGGRRFALVGTSSRALGRGRDEPGEPAHHRLDRGRLERVARGQDVPRVRLRDDRGADRSRHRRPARPRPPCQGADLERHLHVGALALDRPGDGPALRQRHAVGHARARSLGRPDQPARGRASSPTSTSTTATRAATVLYAAAIRDGFLAMLDVSRPDAIREISRFTTGGSFTHNAWLTRDGRYLFTTDERAGLAARGLGPARLASRARSRSTSARPARSRTT